MIAVLSSIECSFCIFGSGFCLGNFIALLLAIVLLIMNFALFDNFEVFVEGLELNGPMSFLVVIHGGERVNGVAFNNMQRNFFDSLLFVFDNELERLFSMISGTGLGWKRAVPDHGLEFILKWEQLISFIIGDDADRVFDIEHGLVEVVLRETVIFSELGVARVFLEIGTRHFHLWANC